MITQNKYFLSLRLPFLTVSIIPFIFGSTIGHHSFSWLKFFLGLFAVIFLHLGANLINDYADSRSGCDWKDSRRYGFFGGSKMIQQGKLTEKFYFLFAIFCVGLSLVFIVLMTVVMSDVKTVFYGSLIIILAWFYSAKPFQFAYRGIGELIIFLLFGPALVMGGYYIQTGIFSDLEPFMLSLPLGFFTMAILFCNEIPDYVVDKAANKNNWVVRIGPQKSYVMFFLIIIGGFATVIVNVGMGFLDKLALVTIFLLLLGLKAGYVLKRHYNYKEKLILASKLTVLMHNLVGLGLIIVGGLT